MVKRLIDSDKQLLAEFKAKKELVEKRKKSLKDNKAKFIDNKGMSVQRKL